MPTPMDFAGRWVMITGASSGLGLAMAHELARRHRANLVLVARRRARMQALQAELEARYDVRARVVAADLAMESERERAFAEATSAQDLYGVVLNAGVTHFGEQVKMSWGEFKQMLDINVLGTAHLAHLSLPYLLNKNQGGGVLFVASLAGVLPVPYQAAYSGTKAFVMSFGHGLWHELAGTSVSVTTLVPGGIATEMIERSGLSSYFGRTSLFLQSPESCAREAVEAFRLREHTHVTGRLNRLGALASKLLPRAFVVERLAAEYRKALALKAKT